LGDDCVVDEHEHNLITTLLPGILVRSNESIALSYPERFVGDDGRFDPVEDTVMNRFLFGAVMTERIVGSSWLFRARRQRACSDS
jgi:hypothetical protein